MRPSASRYILSVVAALALCFVPLLHVGAEEPPLLFGTSTATTGPAKQLGLEMSTGMKMAFAEANETGGINGRELKLIVRDDGYEPQRTVENLQDLIHKDRVLALVGNVGTPTTLTALPILAREKIVLFGPFTGAAPLRKPPYEEYVINYRASYAEEIEKILSFLIEELDYAAEEIALFTQRDSFGDAGYESAINSFRAYGLSDKSKIAHARFERNTLNVESGIARLMLRSHEPRALLMIAPYAQVGQIVHLCRENNFDPHFFTVSFAGSHALSRVLQHEGDRIFVTEVVPNLPNEAPILSEFADAYKKHTPNTEASNVHLEGFIVGKTLINALLRVDGEVSRATVKSALESLDEEDIGLGFPLTISPTEHQASHRVWLSVVRKGSVQPLAWDNLSGYVEGVLP